MFKWWLSHPRLAKLSSQIKNLVRRGSVICNLTLDAVVVQTVEMDSEQCVTREWSLFTEATVAISPCVGSTNEGGFLHIPILPLSPLTPIVPMQGWS